MQKQAPGVGRILVMVGFALSCFCLLLFLWLTFGGSIPLQPKGFRFQIQVPEATQLAKQADVRISGVPVGKVTDLKLGKGNDTSVTIQIDRKYAPIASDTIATLRQKTLLGETYVELTPGNRGKGQDLKEGGTLKTRIFPTVELDEIFRAFDAPTRKAFQTWLQSQSAAFKGSGRNLNDVLGNLAPFAVDTNQLLKILRSQRSAVHDIVRNTGDVFGALNERDGQLADLVRQSNAVFSTTAARNRDLQAAFVVLPTFEHEGELTVNRLTRFARNTNPLITQLRPAARELSPTLQDVERLSPDLKALFQDLDPLIAASKPGLPALRRLLNELRPALGQFDPFLRNLNPILDFATLYKREASTFFANTVAATEVTDQPAKAKKPVHYLRTTNPVNPEILAIYPNRIGSNRPNAYQLPGGASRLASGLQYYETRQCGRGTPTAPTSPPLIPNLPVPVPGVKTITGIIGSTIFGAAGAAIPAPKCTQQPKFPAPYGTEYPQVAARAAALAVT